MKHSARAVDDETQQQQPNQDDKQLPRRCFHALVSVAGATIAVKFAGGRASSNLRQRCGTLGAPALESLVEFFQPFGLAAGASPGFSGGQRESRRGRSAPAAQSLQMDSVSRGSSPAN